MQNKYKKEELETLKQVRTKLYLLEIGPIRLERLYSGFNKRIKELER